MRSNRVRSLLGLAPNEQNIPGLDGGSSPIEPVVNGEGLVKQKRPDQANR